MSVMNKHEGFTIVEVMIVIVVIGILSTIGTVAWLQARENAAESALKSDVSRLKTAIEKYFSEQGEYPFPASPSSPCAVASPTSRQCYQGELAAVLTPKYINSIPKNRDGSDIVYAASRTDGGTTDDGYSLQVKLNTSGSATCKTGKDPQHRFFVTDPTCNL